MADSHPVRDINPCISELIFKAGAGPARENKAPRYNTGTDHLSTSRTSGRSLKCLLKTRNSLKCLQNTSSVWLADEHIYFDDFRWRERDSLSIDLDGHVAISLFLVRSRKCLHFRYRAVLHRMWRFNCKKDGKLFLLTWTMSCILNKICWKHCVLSSAVDSITGKFCSLWGT